MSYDQYRPSGFSLLPPVVKNLLIINIILFIAYTALGMNFNIDLTDYLGLHYFLSDKFRIWQIITYMFMHGSFMHLLFNMLAVWMFGYVLENYWGSKRFLIYYIITGIGAALIHYTIQHFQIASVISLMDNYIANPTLENLNLFVSSHNFYISKSFSNPEIVEAFNLFEKNYNQLQVNPGEAEAVQACVNFISIYKQYFVSLPGFTIVGASGSLFGILIAFGMLFPNTIMYIIFFPIPIKAKYMVIIYGLIEFIDGIMNRPGDNVAHFAHLGGMLFGFILIKIWQRKRFH